MGSRLLPVLLFAIACAAGSLYWMSRGEEGEAREASRGAPAPERVAEAGPTALLERPEERATVGGSGAPGAARTSVAAPPEPDPAPSARAGGPRVTGRVLDQDGAPIEGAQVLATNDPAGLFVGLARDRQSVRTDAQGRFELAGMSYGSALFEVRAAGYAPFHDDDVALPSGAAEIALDPFRLSQGALLSGRVVDAAGVPVPGARLKVLEERARGFEVLVLGAEREPDAIAGDDGSFRIDRLAVGKWKVRVASEEHPARTFEGMTERPGQQVGGLELRLGDGATIAGRLVGAPIEEADGLFVSARAARGGDLESLASLGETRTAAVGADGAFELHGLLPDTDYLVEARSQDPDSFALFGGRARSDQVRARSGERGVQLRYQEEATVAFRVLDARTREPITEYDVTYGLDILQPLRDDDGRALRQHPDGYARLDRLRMRTQEQRLKLAIRAAGYRDFRRDDIAVPEGDLLDLGRIFLEPVALLSVRVTDAKTGAPVVGARVSLAEVQRSGTTVEHRISIGGDEDGGHVVGDDPSARTDASGLARLSAPEGEERTLRVQAPGFAGYASDPLFFPPGEDVEHAVRLGPGGSVLVRALRSDGTPLAGARVEHRAPADLAGGALLLSGAEMRDALSDANGELRFQNLETGTHAFRLQEDGGPGGVFAAEGSFQIVGLPDAGEDDWSRIEVVEAEEGVLELVASPRGSLAGQVSEAGAPLAGASLKLVDAEKASGPLAGLALPGMDSGPRARTDGRGRYLLEDVKVGRYVLRVEHPGRHMPEELSLTVREGENRFDVDLAVTIVEGRVTGADGKPLAGLRVSAAKAEPAGRAVRFMMIMDTDGGDTVVSGGEDLGAQRALTDEDGRYSLRGVTSGVDLVVKAGGDEVQDGSSEKVRLAPGEVRRGLDVRCEPAGSIEVQALLADGAPARFCTVRGEFQGEDRSVSPEFAFLESGTTTLRGLRPGPWRLTVDRQGGPGSGGGSGGTQRTVQVVAGETAHETVQLD